MKKWRIVYESSSDGDCCSVWCNASSKEAAIDYVKGEYWDIKEIIDCYEI